MAFDAFLKLDGIDGDSAVQGHEKWIEVTSFTWGVSQDTSQRFGGGAGAGKATFQDLSFVANFSRASPEIFKRCATGEHIKSGILSVVRKAGDKPLEFYKLRLTDVLVSSYQDGGASGGSDVPMESISLNFTDLAIDFKPQSPTGD